MRTSLTALAILAAVATASPARAQTLEIVALDDEGAVSGGPIQARVGERVSLRVVARDGRRRAPVAGTVRWYRIAPHMQHEDTPPPNASTQQYSNSVLFGPRHGRWIGYDQVEYETAPIGGSGDTLILDRVPTPAGERAPRFGGAGTVWITATVTARDGTVLAAPGVEERDRLGLSREVMRVSFRRDDTFLGWLGTYFHVPNVFGSTGPQVDRYVGADCADVLVGAMRASGRRRVRYTSVQGIASVARPVSPVLVITADGSVRDEDGEAVALRWGDAVEVGDFLAIDYTTAGAQLPRPWDHIGALLGDGDRDGVLSGGDGLRHMTPRGLLDRPLSREGEIRFRVWRPR